MATRIYHRYDSKTNWDTQKAAGYGHLLKGEVGVSYQVVGNYTVYEGYLGVSATPTDYDACPLMFRAVVSNIQQAIPDVFEPVVVKVDAGITSGATVVWNDTIKAWEATNEVLSLESYPTANGNVAWDQVLGKFVVGAAVSTVGIDGGVY